MKKTMRYILSAVVVAATLTACESYTAPEPEFPVYDWEANMTIAELKALHEKGALPHFIEGTDTFVVKGVITGDDESGNIYKSLYLQDETGGINLAIDQVNMYNIMPVGQTVFVRLNGLYIGDYHGAHQLGYANGAEMGRWDWTWEVFRDPTTGLYPNKHYYPSGVPDKAQVPAPMEINSADDLSDDVVGRLVTLKNVTFDNGGAATWAVKEENTNQNLKFADGTSMIVRTSGYSNFYADTIPAGTGDISGIMSVYNSTYQLLIRDREDIGDFK